MLAVISTDSLFLEYLPIMVKRISFIEGPPYGTIYLCVLPGPQHCRHFEKIILILNCFA